jgi:hypothetical protein
LQIKDKTELMKRKCELSHEFRLSIDWIHNLVYYNINNKIFIFNMTDRRYEYLVIEEVGYIRDISVNPLASILFYSTKRKIMKASQDGQNRTQLTSHNINKPNALTIDLVLRKVFWTDYYSNTFSSIDFDGNNFMTFGRYKSTDFDTFM